MIDSHCHLNTERFCELFASKVSSEAEYNEKYSTDAIVKRALDANVNCLLTIGESLSTAEETLPIIDKYDCVFRTVGIHPQEAEKHLEKYSAYEIYQIIKKHCEHKKTVGIGEIGLDYSQGREDEAIQKRLFHLQLEIADELHLPISIHSREAQVDTIAILKAYPNVKGVVHCFSGEEYFADAILDLGFYIGVGGIVTYKKSDELRNTLKNIPLNRLLVETDAPFLSPVPMRGKINESAFIIYTAEKIAEILDVSISEIDKNTTENFLTLFSKVNLK